MARAIKFDIRRQRFRPFKLVPDKVLPTLRSPFLLRALLLMYGRLKKFYAFSPPLP